MFFLFGGMEKEENNGNTKFDLFLLKLVDVYFVYIDNLTLVYWYLNNIYLREASSSDI